MKVFSSQSEILTQGRLSELNNLDADTIEYIKKLEHKLRKSEIRLNETQRIAKIGSWEMHFDSSEVFWSDEAYVIFEVDKSYFAASSYDSFLALIHPEDKERIDKTFYDSIVAKRPFEDGCRLWMKDGRIKHISMRCDVYYNEHGIPSYSIGTMQDVTEQKSLEESLIAKELKFRSLAENSPDIIVRYDIHGRRVYVNQAIDNYKHTNAVAELLGDMSIQKSIPGEKQLAIINSVIQTKKSVEKESVLTAVDGSKHYFSIRLTPEFSRDDDVIGVLCIASDITSRKEFEARLMKAEGAAVAASKAKSEFLANMSHEIRTPLNAISGMSTLLINSDMDEKCHSYARSIISASDTLLSLIGDILDFSKIEAGKMLLTKERIDLEKLVKDMGDMFLVRAKEKNIDFNIDIDEKMPRFIIGDELRLKQIVINLVSNAVKFTNYGSVLLEIRAENIEDARADIYIGVKDTGIGMSEEQQKELFSEFYQGNLSNTKIYGGTGLGLSITKKITELFGGNIDFESEIGHGSYFHVKIPFEVIESGNISASDSGAMSFGEAKGILSGKNMLVVDDNAVNRKMLIGILEYLGASSKEAVNGVAAVAAMQKEDNAFDMILMDLQMPIMDGYEATKRIRKMGVTLPIIALSADVTAQTMKNALESGMDDYLPKPFEYDRLLSVFMGRLGIPIPKKQANAKTSEFDFELPQLSSVDVGRGMIIFEDVSVYVSVLKKLSNSVDENRAELTTKLASYDIEGAKKIVHAMKGACANMGAFKLFEACLNLENAMKTNDIDGINQYMDSLDKATAEYKQDMDILNTFFMPHNNENKIEFEADMLVSLLEAVQNKEVKAKEMTRNILKECDMDEDIRLCIAQSIEALERYDFEAANIILSKVTPTKKDSK